MNEHIRQTHHHSGLPVAGWLTALEQPEDLAAFRAAYGSDAGLIRERATLARRALQAFRERFGDLPVRLFRAPGRTNLRGMHVDTHGGFLNLMTHQREVVLVAARSEGDVSALANVNPAFNEVAFRTEEESGYTGEPESWFDFISQPAVRKRVNARGSLPARAWANYLIGAALRVSREVPGSPPPGLKMMVDSDLPSGAALSSSAALSVASLMAFKAYTGAALSMEQLIRAEQDVEWYAGARVGMSDQTAILMGKQGRMLHLSVFAEDFSLEGARYIPFPDALKLLVIHSHTTRNLSGAQRARYSLNRFAYSMALTVLRKELLQSGWENGQVRSLDRLSRLTPEALGGVERVYKLLVRIPETIDLDSLRQRYAPPGLEEAYARYFDGVPEEQQPRQIPLRGPLLFGIAESERARCFPGLFEQGAHQEAGSLMTIGHDGDRVMGRDGHPYAMDVSDPALAALAAVRLPLARCPGKYGASSPALDALVDAACASGALGASLTGAGIAGAVLALCRDEDAASVTSGVLGCLRSEAYARLAGWSTPPAASDIDRAVVANHAVAGAGELVLE